MKLSHIINKPLGLFGLHLARKSKLELVNVSDIHKDKGFMSVYGKIKPYTLVPIERCYALYQSVNYIVKNSIDGDFVECGVWKGGSCMLIALTLAHAGDLHRDIYLYDTFEGMTKPGDMDGEEERMLWEKGRVSETSNTLCYSPIEEVTENIRSTNYPFEKIRIVRGKVEETIPGNMPGKIALLRLDTDWYESTRHELQHLYPLLVKNGILLVDDYGAWQGSRKAVDEYFEFIPNIFLHRIDYTGRLVVKQGIDQ